MRAVLRSVPGLLWVSVVFRGLGVWGQDGRGLLIAAFCAVLGFAQLLHDPDRTDPDDVDPIEW
ncbi:MAG: hypothetical protein CMH83_13255 [Nocardioides sp.]|nr:hypothetical protein [Nocardioides sp.]